MRAWRRARIAVTIAAFRAADVRSKNTLATQTAKEVDRTEEISEYRQLFFDVDLFEGIVNATKLRSHWQEFTKDTERVAAMLFRPI